MVKTSGTRHFDTWGGKVYSSWGILVGPSSGSEWTLDISDGSPNSYSKNPRTSPIYIGMDCYFNGFKTRRPFSSSLYLQFSSRLCPRVTAGGAVGFEVLSTGKDCRDVEYSSLL